MRVPMLLLGITTVLAQPSATRIDREALVGRHSPVLTGLDVAMLGVLPGRDIDRDAMRRTFDWIWGHWQWADTWGWDYPMTAMTAARLP